MKKIKELRTETFRRFILTPFLLVFCVDVSMYAQSLRNCSEIHFYNPTAPSGVYAIDPDVNGPAPVMDCQCDMTTDGGGWTLVLNYNHLANTNPALNVTSTVLPLQGQTSLGIDESNTLFWGHAGTGLMTDLPFDEVRFYGISSGHNRIIDFKTAHSGTVTYFKTGLGSTEGIKTNFTPLASHSSFLPASIDNTVYDMGDFAMTSYPLWTGSAYHWYLAGSDPACQQRWEVDDYPCNTPSTFHQIWVRQNAFLGIKSEQKSKPEINLSPNPMNGAAQLTLVCIPQISSENLSLIVYNSAGMQVFPEITRNAESLVIKRGMLAPGIYLCRLVNDTELIGSVKMILD